MANGQKSDRKPIRRFEDLEVWQLARELVRGVYRAAQSQGLRRDLPLSSQMKRAAVSICSNIAEGYERGTRKQYIEFIYIAKGSAGELRCQLILAHDVGMLDAKAYDWLLERCEKCSRMLAGYLKHLKATSTKFRGTKFEEPSADRREESA